MKKLLVLFSVVLMLGGFVCAETYEVKSVTGRVTYESAPGKWAELKKNQKISDSTVLNTSLNSRVVLVAEDKSEVTIKPMQKGEAAALVKSNKGEGNGLKKNPSATAAKKDVAGEVTENAKGTSTASSRASEAKEDFEIDE